jgi:hypothetical protein
VLYAVMNYLVRHGSKYEALLGKNAADIFEIS